MNAKRGYNKLTYLGYFYNYFDQGQDCYLKNITDSR